MKEAICTLDDTKWRYLGAGEAISWNNGYKSGVRGPIALSLGITSTTEAITEAFYVAKRPNYHAINCIGLDLRADHKNYPHPSARYMGRRGSPVAFLIGGQGPRTHRQIWPYTKAQ